MTVYSSLLLIFTLVMTIGNTEAAKKGRKPDASVDRDDPAYIIILILAICVIIEFIIVLANHCRTRKQENITTKQSTRSRVLGRKMYGHPDSSELVSASFGPQSDTLVTSIKIKFKRSVEVLNHQRNKKSTQSRTMDSSNVSASINSPNKTMDIISVDNVRFHGDEGKLLQERSGSRSQGFPSVPLSTTTGLGTGTVHSEAFSSAAGNTNTHLANRPSLTVSEVFNNPAPGASVTITGAGSIGNADATSVKHMVSYPEGSKLNLTSLGNVPNPDVAKRAIKVASENQSTDAVKETAPLRKITSRGGVSALPDSKKANVETKPKLLLSPKMASTEGAKDVPLPVIKIVTVHAVDNAVPVDNISNENPKLNDINKVKI